MRFSDEDQRAKLRLCSKYLETFTQIKEQEKSFAELSIDLLVGMRDMLLTDELVLLLIALPFKFRYFIFYILCNLSVFVNWSIQNCTLVLIPCQIYIHSVLSGVVS